ncbi:MAG: hypothetical protein LIO67_06780 [Lachnospiraceae bacterium]|nr:hypothetical protein [Lachnospiraceae bacterium]
MAAGILYSFQLYADFQACVCIAKGVSEMFGIHLADNFRHPYFSRSTGEFWRRWHISLSSWLRDYVYIPLGGNRKGRLRKYFNLIVTFAVSGMWHGGGLKYLFWGLLHAGYQIIGDVLKPIRKGVYRLFRIGEEETLAVLIQTLFTFVCVMFGWILFRADSLRIGLSMIRSVFTVYNPWIFFDDSLFELGLGWRDCVILFLSLLLLLAVSLLQNRKVSLSKLIMKQHILLRWSIYFLMIAVIWILGTYGFGFNAQDFIYGGF